MTPTTRQRPERGQAVPDREYPDAIEGFHYDWFTIARKAPTRRRMPVAHYSAFAVIFLSLCVATYADLGPRGYQMRVERLLGSHGLEWVAGKVMSLDGIAEHATGRLLALLDLLEPDRA